MGLFKYIAKNIFNAFFDLDSIKGKVGEIQVDSTLNPYLFGKVKHR